MTYSSTSMNTRREAAMSLIAGVVVCGQVFGMKPAAQHAINPRDPGGRTL
jgi:hypothetical protein